MSQPVMSEDSLGKDVAAIARIDVVPAILEVICRSTGMGFAAVARVTEDRWIACAVRDDIGFGLTPGGELVVATTICDEIRDSGQRVVIDDVSVDARYCDHPTPAKYGLQSYISVPLRRVDGRFFGTLCAIDPKPARLDTPEIVGMFELFANLISLHLDAQERLAERERALAHSQVLVRLDEGLRSAGDAGAALQHAVDLLGGTLGATCRFVDAALAGDAAAAGKASMAIPLRRDGEWTTSLSVSSREARDWQPWERELAQNVAERAWHTAERLRLAQAKDEFLATLSHELRTPLNAVIGWTRLLRTGSLPVEEIERALGSLERNAEAQARLVEDLLDMSRIVSGKLQLEQRRLDFATVVRDVLAEARPTAERRNVALHGGLFPSAAVCGEGARLRQVVANLVSNAIKFTPSGGHVNVGLRVHQDTVELSVDDSGAGIDPGFLPFVFDRFAQADSGMTRQHGGLGLGLAIVRHIAEAHRGSVEAASAGAGRGATFVLRLPVDLTSEHAQPSTADPGHVDRILLTGMTVLVVDDDDDARHLLRVMLEQHGAAIRLAASAADARAVMADARVDVLIADIGMPEEDGVSFVRRMRAVSAGGAMPQAIAVTAYAGAREREWARQAGFGWYITKPVNPDELLSAVAAAVEQRRA